MSFNPRPARGPGAAHGLSTTGRTRRGGFNPRPARGPGAALDPLGPDPHGGRRFNPRPARGPGAAGIHFWTRAFALLVSILARPAGRALP